MRSKTGAISLKMARGAALLNTLVSTGSATAARARVSAARTAATAATVVAV